MDNLTDEQLVEFYLKGDSKALDFLIQKNLDAVYNFVFKYVHTIEEAEDVTQETFIKAWQKLNKFNAQYKFKTWLFTIAKNTALDHLKKRGLIPFSHLENETNNNYADNLSSHDPLPEELMIRIEDMQMIGLAVDKLPKKYHQIISLYYNDQLNFREISELLKESINTIKTRHRRALPYLKREIFDR